MSPARRTRLHAFRRHLLPPAELASRKESSRALTSLPEEMITAWQQAVFAFSRSGRFWPRILKEHQGHLEKIWQTYNQSRGDLQRLPLNTAPWVAPYLLGFHLSNVGRLIQVLNRLAQRHPSLVAKWQRARILDIGCGTGAGSLALLALVPKADRSLWQVELLDRSRHFLKAAEMQVKHLAEDIPLRSMASDLLEPRSREVLQKLQRGAETPQFIIMSYLWNELFHHRQGLEFFLSWLEGWARSSQETVLILADPAEELSARRMIQLRDHLCDLGFLNLYPCPQSGACPMSESGRDWCYSEVEFAKPPELDQVERRLRISRRTLGVSAYIFANKTATTNWALDETSKHKVIVGRPKVNGKEAWLLCSAKGLDRIPAENKKGLKGSDYL